MGRLRFGVDPDLEAAADEILRRSWGDSKTFQNPARDDGSTILTRASMERKRRREVFMRTGVADGQRAGMFHKVSHPGRPWLMSVDGYLRVRRVPWDAGRHREDH